MHRRALGASFETKRRMLHLQPPPRALFALGSCFQAESGCDGGLANTPFPHHNDSAFIRDHAHQDWTSQ